MEQQPCKRPVRGMRLLISSGLGSKKRGLQRLEDGGVGACFREPIGKAEVFFSFGLGGKEGVQGFVC